MHLDVDSIRLRAFGFIAAVVLLSTILASALSAQTEEASPTTDLTSLYRSIVGDWIGTCEQSTDGEQAENKYFHAVIKETAPNTFSTTFSYYRSDGATDTPVHVGDTTAVLTIQPDGTIKNEIEGSGTVLVEKQPKQQSHKLTEVLTTTGPASMAGKITGKISVSGLPFGLGKNGEVSDGKSTYSLKDGVLTISQTLKAGFKILIAKKTFTIQATSVARRGTDVAEVMKADHIAAKTHAPKTPGT